jgi:hypothetical protein
LVSYSHAIQRCQHHHQLDRSASNRSIAALRSGNVTWVQMPDTHLSVQPWALRLAATQVLMEATWPDRTEDAFFLIGSRDIEIAQGRPPITVLGRRLGHLGRDWFYRLPRNAVVAHAY